HAARRGHAPRRRLRRVARGVAARARAGRASARHALSAPKTSVVVVAADSGPLLPQCVDRVLASSGPVEIVVVDNASQDGFAAKAAAAHASDARFRLIENADNRGFGPACNQGAAAATGDALVFLNPDCLIDADTIAALRAIADADQSIGLLGVDVRTPEGTPA